jgi:hypothetical protein
MEPNELDNLNLHCPDHSGKTVPLDLYLDALEQTLQSADELLTRPLRQGGFEVVIGCDRLPSRDILRRLAKCSDRMALLEHAALSLDRQESESPPPPRQFQSVLDQFRKLGLHFLWSSLRQHAAVQTP